MRIEYLVCTAQENRVTFVNGAWQGTLPPADRESLQSCPEVWMYLQSMGDAGWELVTAIGRSRSRAEDEPVLDRLLLGSSHEKCGWHSWDTLYLKRARP